METPTPVGFRQSRSQFADVAWRVSGVALVAFGGWLALTTAAEVRRLARVLPPTPPEVAADVVVRNVEDRSGRAASFRILLFTDEFRWRLNSFRELEHATDRPHFTEEMKAVLNDAKEIICVGASSEEMPAGRSGRAGRTAEEWRAARRADQIAVWVREALGRPTPVRKLNAGYHAPTGHPGDTGDQRRMVIILVLDHDEDADIDEALRAAMMRESPRAPIFDTLLTRYSLSKGPDFAWVP